MELAGFSLQVLSLLFAVAIIAGLLDTLAGGGGLITLPALILSGLSPLSALGTNKLQGSMGTATATCLMLKNKRIAWDDVKFLMLTAFIGSVLGTIAVQFINAEILSLVVPAVLLFIAGYFLLAPLISTLPKGSEPTTTPKLSSTHYRNRVIPPIGFYDGMFGPGTGSFFALAGVACRGQSILSATAIAKPLNFSTNIASLIVFLFTGKIVWVIGLLMIVGQFIGAWLGAHVLFKINPGVLRGIVVFMCLAMLVKYSDSMGWISF